MDRTTFADTHREGGHVAVSTLRSTVRLNNGTRMPMLGLGCIETETGNETQHAVETAIEIGYRFIDTASVYENEADVGKALRHAAVPRQDIFLSTKVWNSDQGYSETLRAFDRSLEQLGVDYVDLYSLHWPLIRLRAESWRAIVRLVEEGRCRAAGVCNYAIRHLRELLQESDLVPVTNQVEFNPFLNQNALRDWCRHRDIQLITHSPLARGARSKDRRVAEIAGRYGKSAQQLLLRWALQRGLAVLTRVTSPEEVRAHADVFDFDISLRDMDSLDSLNENLRVGWDPTNAP
jgi:diketogulonate reductase-like aldo/keto reductase